MENLSSVKLFNSDVRFFDYHDCVRLVNFQFKFLLLKQKKSLVQPGQGNAKSN